LKPKMKYIKGNEYILCRTKNDAFTIARGVFLAANVAAIADKARITNVLYKENETR
jgi:hypothetical protein